MQKAGHALKTLLPAPSNVALLPLRWLGIAFVYLYLVLYWLYRFVTGIQPITIKVWMALNDPDLIDVTARRLYVYSRSDDMVDWKDVVAHGKAARARDESREGTEAEADRKASNNGTTGTGGSSVRGKVRIEEYIGTKHVAHIVGDATRYWGAIQEVWAEAVKDRSGA